MAERIDDLSERRRRLNSQPWHLWTSDREARINLLTKLIEEAYAEKRREQADVSGQARGRARRHG